MSALEKSILTLPKHVQSTINLRCHSLNPVISASIFEPKICLDSFDSTESRYIFSIFFKHRIVQVENSATHIIHHQKTLVEQIELLVEEDETKPKLSEKDGFERIESFKKAINNFIMDSPFFTHIRKRNSQYACIDSTNFEAKCSQNEEPIVKSSLEATWLPAVDLGQYIIRIGLFSHPSQEITSLVDDYLSIFTSNLAKTQKTAAKEEAKSPSLDDSWEVLEDEEDEKAKEEKNESEPVAKNEQSELPVQEEEKKISENEIQKSEIKEEEEKVPNHESQVENEVKSLESLEKQRIRDENKAKFMGKLYEYTELLKKMSDKKFKRREDSCQNLLNKENNFLYTLTSNNGI